MPARSPARDTSPASRPSPASGSSVSATDGARIAQGIYEENIPKLLPTLWQEFDVGLLRQFNFIAIQSILFERALFDTRGGFVEELDALEDWNLWVRYARGNHFAYVPNVTSMFRTPASQDDACNRQYLLNSHYKIAMANAEADGRNASGATRPRTLRRMRA